MRHPCFVVLNALVLLYSTTLLAAQEKEAKPQKQAEQDKETRQEKALQTAARILVQSQERYTRDRPVGRLSNDRLKEWQDEERARLQKLPLERRRRAWARCARDVAPEKLDAITQVVPLSKVLEFGPEILKGQVRGRVVVDVNA